MKTYVIDASVVVGAIMLSNERAHKEFTSLLLQSHEHQAVLYSIPLVVAEITNGMRYSTKDADFAKESLTKFFSLPIETIEVTSEQWKSAMAQSYAHGTTVYDTIYHVVAMALGATFITCDGEYYKKAKSLGNMKLI